MTEIEAVPLALHDFSVSVPDGRHRRTLINQVDLSVAAGEILVVSGSSGSGKSTLLAAAGLLRRPDSGEVVIGGKPVSSLSERARTTVRREEIAIVYQAANLLPALTAIEQLELIGHIGRESRASARRRAESLLSEVGLNGHNDQLPEEMSGGERQRVGIARALMASPSVLLADEPTASLDHELSSQVLELLAEQTARLGPATIIVSHDDVPNAHAHRRLHLADGKLEQVPAADATLPMNE